MHDLTTRSVEDLHSHTERGNEGTAARGGAAWPLLLLLVLAAVTLLAIQIRRPQAQDALVGLALPPLDVGGWLNSENPLSSRDLRGHVVLVDFWMSDCGPCLAHTPELVEYRKRFRDRGVLMVGFTPETGDAVTRVRSYIETVDGYDWPVGFGAHMVFERMGIYGTPTYVLYDRSGVSVWGSHGLAGLEEATIAALAKQ